MRSLVHLRSGDWSLLICSFHVSENLLLSPFQKFNTSL